MGNSLVTSGYDRTRKDKPVQVDGSLGSTGAGGVVGVGMVGVVSDGGGGGAVEAVVAVVVVDLTLSVNCRGVDLTGD